MYMYVHVDLVHPFLFPDDAIMTLVLLRVARRVVASQPSARQRFSAGRSVGRWAKPLTAELIGQHLRS